MSNRDAADKLREVTEWAIRSHEKEGCECGNPGPVTVPLHDVIDVLGRLADAEGHLATAQGRLAAATQLADAGTLRPQRGLRYVSVEDLRAALGVEP